MKKVTMQDIADTLSVSRITVWKALNNKEGVSQELREKILGSAREMGYFHAVPATEKESCPALILPARHLPRSCRGLNLPSFGCASFTTSPKS